MMVLAFKKQVPKYDSAIFTQNTESENSKLRIPRQSSS